MTERHATIEDYLASLAADQAAATSAVVERVRQAVPDAIEAISYDMPTFHLPNGRPIFVAAWKQHLSLHAVPGFDPDLEPDVAPYRSAKGTLKFRYRNPIPLELITRITLAIAALQREP
jgi:uncharacterized protein YdhG (YjbR/CyaY superfamily)